MSSSLCSKKRKGNLKKSVSDNDHINKNSTKMSCPKLLCIFLPVPMI